MKTNLIISIAFLFLTLTTFAQESSSSRVYESWIHLKEPDRKIKGYLREAKDSSVLFSSYALFEKKEIPYEQISKIQFRREKSIGRGFLWGSLAAISTVYIASFTDEDVRETPTLGILYVGLLAIPAGVLGGGIGAAAGAAKISIPIGKKSRKKEQERLNKYRVHSFQ